jgi:3-oxoadipate enol-lactonase
MIVHIGNADMNVEVGGEGKPLILIHGLGADLNLWNHVVPYLCKRRKVIRYDLRGAGLTRSAEKHLSIDLWASDLESIMDHFGIETASLVGWSLGGMISILFSINKPNRTEALALVGSTARLQQNAIEIFKQRAELARTIGMRSLIEKTFQASLEAFAPSSRRDRPEVINTYRSMLESYDGNSYAAACEAVNEVDLREKLKEVKLPCLIIVGKYDPRTPMLDAEMMCKAIPGAIMKILPDCGHFYPLEQPERLSYEIQSFLDSVDRLERN